VLCRNIARLPRMATATVGGPVLAATTNAPIWKGPQPGTTGQAVFGNGNERPPGSQQGSDPGRRRPRFARVRSIRRTSVVSQPPAPLIMKQPGSARLVCEDLPRTPRPIQVVVVRPSLVDPTDEPEWPTVEPARQEKESST
jgi:hypothetical protein